MRDCRVTIDDGRFTWRQEKSELVAWNIRLGGGRPPAIDFSNANPRMTHLGIYRLSGDTLTICCAEPEVGLRPTAFDASQKGYELMVLKRGGR